MNNEPIVVEQLLDAPVSRVWKAITDKEEMKDWYFRLDDFKAEPGFKFQFYGGEEGGTQWLHLCEITEVDPGKKLTYSWRYDGMPGMSHVTFGLQEQGDKTLLTITHAGVESFAAGGPEFVKNNFVEGWTYFAKTALKDYVEGVTK